MTTQIGVQAEFTVTSREVDGTASPLDPEALREECDRLMEALLDMEASGCKIGDAAVAADFGRGIVELSLTATGDDFEAAEACAWASFRAAIHKIGGHTPEWPAVFTATSKRSELLPVG
jgi:hypothetical protein